MKIYIVRGFYESDWESHFILKAFSKKENAIELANNTTEIDGWRVKCYVEEVELI